MPDSQRLSKRAAAVVVVGGPALAGSAAAAGRSTLDSRADPLTLSASAAGAGGPVGGRDAFEAEIEREFAAHGVRLRWVEDWYDAHLLLGEVHCTSNVLRDPRGATPWWRAS